MRFTLSLSSPSALCGLATAGLLALSSAATSASAAQIPFVGLSEPARPAAAAPISLLGHPSHPAHTLRVTNPSGSLCERDEHARSWSGYLDVDLDKLWEEMSDEQRAEIAPQRHEKHPEGVTEHFYFWAFESRSDPENDPVVLWLNGGPGCSSFTGLLMELGPCNAASFNGSEGPHTEWNPHSWNNNATMVFLDQPIGVGYSYSAWTDPKRNGTAPARIYDTPSAARDTSAFLHLLALHSKAVFGGGDEDGKALSSFHMAGESYAGRYLPLIASQILRDNKEAEAHPERGIQPLPLASVLIGNGITSPKDQFPAYVDYACSNEHGYGTFYPKEQCDTMYEDIPTCLALTDKCNAVGGLASTSEYDVLACKLALNYCEEKLSSPWYVDGKSPYDWRHYGEYEEEAWVAAFLNSNHTRHALGVDHDRGAGDDHDGTFVGCSDAVYKHFEKYGDGARDSTWAVRDVLEQGTRVLAYFGKADFICNYLGGQAWTTGLEWSGAEGFRAAPLEPWNTPGAGAAADAAAAAAGSFRTYGNLTYAEIEDSGHFCPHDQPAAALAMVNYWLHGSKPGRLEP